MRSSVFQRAEMTLVYAEWSVSTLHQAGLVAHVFPFLSFQAFLAQHVICDQLLAKAVQLVTSRVLSQLNFTELA